MVVQDQENQEEDEHQVQESQTYYCPECNKGFSSRRALGGHKSGAHIRTKKDHSIKNTKTEHTEDSKLLCSEEFSSRRALHGHSRSHPDRDLRGMGQPSSSGIVIALPAQARAPEYSSGIDLNQRLRSWSIRGKRGRPAAISRGIDSYGSEPTIEITNDGSTKVREMVGDLERHKSQGPDFSGHVKESTNETGEKALEFPSKVIEIKGDDPARPQITLKRSKEKSLMIKEDDYAIEMVENLKMHKSQGPDFSDHINESTNETREKALEFSSRTKSTRVTESKGGDQGHARNQITLKRSKEKSLMIKEDDSDVKMVENLKRRKRQGPDFSDHVKEINETVEKAMGFLSRTESTEVTEIKGDDQGPARTRITLKNSKEKGLMIEDDSAIKLVENLKRRKSQGPDFDKETNETREKGLEFSPKTASMKVVEIKGDDQGPGRLKKLEVKRLMKRQKSHGPDFDDHMKETSEPDHKSPQFPSRTDEVDSTNITESTKAAETELDDHCRARTQEKSKEKSPLIEEDSATKVALKEDKFTCRKCGMSFRTGQAFGSHMASHEKVIIRTGNEIDLVHNNNEPASETKKTKNKLVKNTASVTDKVESGENTRSPVEENDETTFDTQPVVKGCSSSSNGPEKNTEIARKGFAFDLNDFAFDLNEMPNEED